MLKMDIRCMPEAESKQIRLECTDCRQITVVTMLPTLVRGAVERPFSRCAVVVENLSGRVFYEDHILQDAWQADREAG